MEIITWIMAHVAELGALLLIVVRLLEAVEALTPDDKDGALRTVIGVLKNFASFGWKKKEE